MDLASILIRCAASSPFVSIAPGVQLFEADQVKRAVAEALRAVVDEAAGAGALEARKDRPGRFTVDQFSDKGARSRMEDRHVVIEDLGQLLGSAPGSGAKHGFFGVYDGHGGVEAADYTAAQLHCAVAADPAFAADPRQALENGFLATDGRFLAKAEREALNCGSTVCAALVHGSKLHTAWLGDSQAILCRAGELVEVMVPHKPELEAERARIEADGGVVVFHGAWRVNGTLSVARAIGDRKLKKWVIGKPDITVTELDGTEDYMVLACDGLWDVMKPEDVIAFVAEWQLANPGVTEGIAEALGTRAISELSSTDNITVLVIFFNK